MLLWHHLDRATGAVKVAATRGGRYRNMKRRRPALAKSVMAAVAWLSASAAQAQMPPPPQHVCDAAEEGHRVVPSVEVAGVQDGAPYQSDVDWMIDRTTTYLPMCSYFTAVGSFSLRSYSLDPFTKTERVLLCHGAAAVSPYTGPCPPALSPPK
jgi:hypothetical protein